MPLDSEPLRQRLHGRFDVSDKRFVREDEDGLGPLLLRGHRLFGATPPQGQSLVELAVSIREPACGGVPGSRIAVDRHDPPVRVVRQVPRTALAPGEAWAERDDPRLRRLTETLVVDPRVEERREVPVEDLSLVSRRIIGAKEPKEPVEEGGDDEKRQGRKVVDLSHVRLLPVPVVKETANERLAQKVYPVVRSSPCPFSAGQSACSGCPTSSSYGVHVKLWMAVEKRVRKCPARTLHL